MKHVCFCFSLLLALPATAQEVADLHPEIEYLDFSPEGEKAWEEHSEKCTAFWERYENLSDEERDFVDTECDEMDPGYYGMISGGCSWYCGGGPMEVRASSYLSSQGATTYDPGNAHDLDYKSAWVEGKRGYGIGESLIYHFNAHAPRITEIIVANGYVKSESAWKSNSRVQQLNLYINEVLYARLHLDDSRSAQHFSVEPIGHLSEVDGIIPEDAPDWTMRFEIAAVYEGDRFDDVVISEIYFDGIDVHCLAADTPVLMADGSSLPIEAIRPGMEVMGYRSLTGERLSAKVRSMANPLHVHLAAVRLANGNTLQITPDHPLLGADGQWYAVDAAKAMADYPHVLVKPLVPGTLLSGADGPVAVGAIAMQHGSTQTYTITALDGADAFIAGGVLVATAQGEAVSSKTISE